MNTPTIDINARVEQYVKLRDLIKEKEDAHKEAMRPYKETLELLNSALLSALNAAGADSARSAAGTVYKTEKKTATVADRQAFLKYVRDSENWDMLDWRANVAAVSEYIDEQIELAKSDPSITPSPPPGVNFSSMFVVGVRRPSNPSK